MMGMGLGMSLQMRPQVAQIQYCTLCDTPIDPVRMGASNKGNFYLASCKAMGVCPQCNTQLLIVDDKAMDDLLIKFQKKKGDHS